MNMTSKVLLFIGIFFLTPAPNCHASILSIALNPATLQSQISGSQVSVTGSIVLENKGDEPALSVYPSFSIGKYFWSGEARDLKVGERAEWTVQASFERDKLSCGVSGDCAGLSLPDKGSFPVVILKRYQDLNRHPFETVEVMQLPIGELSPSDVMQLKQDGISQRLQFRERGSKHIGTLELLNNSSTPISAAVSFVSSAELANETPPQKLELPPRGTVSTKATLQNFNATAGSSYAVSAVVQWEEEGLRRVSITSAQTTIGAGEDKTFLYLAAAATIILAIALVLSIRALKRRV